MKLLQQLEVAVNPYLFFWEEWAGNENCNLDGLEIEIINTCLDNNFKVEFLQVLTDNQSASEIKTILRKLELGYPVFKEFVIFRFMKNLIDMANDYGYEIFLSNPIPQLDLDAEMKSCLLKLKSPSLRVAFITYQPKDFGKKELFRIVTEFHNIYSKNEVSFAKSSP